MINWFIAIFYFLQEFGILNLKQIFTTNLIILCLSRGLYIITYYFNYNKQIEEGAKLFNKRESIYFAFKQVSLILFGMIYLPIAIFISFYSLMMSGNYIKQIGTNQRKRLINIVGNLLNFLAPPIGILWFTFIATDLYSVAALGFSVFVFLNYGVKTSKLSLSMLLEKYRKRRIERISKVIQYILMIFIITFPAIIIISTAIYTPQEKTTVMVEMDDGVKLATDIYFAPGSFGVPKPVILVRTPYGKTGWAYDLYSQVYFIQNYHLVIQDLRGTHDSEGGDNFLLFINDYLDGVDTIEWILEQNWCNGKIASAGVSALCINQYFYAGMGPEGLYAQQLWFGTPELYDHAIFQGSYHKSSVETWVKDAAPNNWMYQLKTIFDFMPKNETMYNSTSLSIPLGPHYSNVSVYGIHVGGWYDHFLQGTLDGFVGYDDFGTSIAKGHQKLIMGPWTHGSVYGGKQGELTYPENSNGFNLILNWETEIFDDALLGIPANWDGARVAYYLMGPVTEKSDKWNYWRYAYDWPLEYENDTWYFRANGHLSKTSAGLTNSNLTYLYDPRFPVPNLGGQNQPFDLAGPMDQTTIENRSDVLLFETPILTEAVETVGRIWGHLFVTSNCTDTDFTVKLTDVYPDGRSMLVTDGSLTVRYRNNYTSEALMTGDENVVYELWIDCWSTAYVFAPGHKIRVAISSSNFPRFAANPNTGEPLAYDYLTQEIANNTLLVGPMYNSSIILPRLVNLSTSHITY